MLSMPRPRVFTDEQHEIVRKMYTSKLMKPAEIVAEIQRRWPEVKVTPKSLSDYCRSKGWIEQRKKRETLVESAAEQEKVVAVIEAKHSQLTSPLEQHKEFITTSAIVASKALLKSEMMIENAKSARDLSAATGAARAAAEMYRKAVGLDESSNRGGSTTNFIFNFATSEESPFAKVKQAQKVEPQAPIIDAEEVEDADPEARPGEDSGASESSE